MIWEQMPPHLDDAYQEYKQAYLDQVEFQPKAEAMLQYSISQFALLTHVISRAHWPPQKWLHAGSWHCCCQDQGVHALTHAWQAGVILPVFDMEQAESVLKAVVKGQSYSGGQIDISSLLQDCDTRIMDLRIANSGDSLLQDLTANSRQLNVFFNSFSFEGLTDLMITGEFANFLARLAKLSNLTCSTRRLHGSSQRQMVHTPQTFGLTDIFANTVWPHLTNLNLERFLTSEAELMNVLARHKFSLRSLSLQYLFLSQGSWYAIFASLRGGSLQQFDVWHLGYKNGASIVYDEVFLSDSEYWAQAPLSESHPLHQFVVHNETWDDSIADDLAANRKCWGFNNGNRLITGI